MSILDNIRLAIIDSLINLGISKTRIKDIEVVKYPDGSFTIKLKVSK